MGAALQPYSDRLVELCRRHRVRRLEVFGSAARSPNIGQTRDVDFMVTFESIPGDNRFARYFDFKEAMEQLLDKPVDLVEESAIDNRAFLKAIQSERTLIYEQ